MKKYFLLFICVIFIGCAAGSTNPLSQSGSIEIKKNLSDIQKIRLGMSYQEVIGVVGNEVIVGFEQNLNNTTIFEPMTVKNPYRADSLRGKEKNYEVLYYLTSVQKADGIIADDELTPLIFEQGRLMAKGWDSLSEIKRKINL